MRVLWLTIGLLPEACRQIGESNGTAGGWLAAMQTSLLSADPTLEMCVLSLDERECDIQVGNTRHVNFGKYRENYYRKIPREIEVKCRRVIGEFNPDVIHVQGTEFFYGCMDHSVYCGKPVVVSLQGILSACHVQLIGNLSSRELWRSQLNARRILKGQTIFGEQTFWRECRTAQEAKVIRQNRFFIGRTDFDQSWVTYYNPQARYFHVDETLREVFYPTEYDAGQVVRHTIYCGPAAGYPLKGAHWLLRAIASLKATYPDIQLRVADAQLKFKNRLNFLERIKDTAYAAYLRKLIRELHIEENVVGLPSLSADAVAAELKCAELFVLPSMCENSSNSLCEAMLVGTPAVATFVGGTPSILKGSDGLLVPSGDPAALAGAIRECFENRQAALSRAANAKATARVRHDPKTNARALLAVYQQVIAEGVK